MTTLTTSPAEETDIDYKTKDSFDKEIAGALLIRPINEWPDYKNIPETLGISMKERTMNPHLISDNGRFLYDIGLVLGDMSQNYDIRQIRAIEKVTGFFEGVKYSHFSMSGKKGFMTASKEPNYSAIESFCNYARNMVIGAIGKTIEGARDSELGNTARIQLAGTKANALKLVPPSNKQ